MLLDANLALGNKQKEQKTESDRKIANLQAQLDKLTGETAGAIARCFHIHYPKVVIMSVNAQSAHSQISERTSVDLAVSRVPELQRPSLLSLKPAS